LVHRSDKSIVPLPDLTRLGIKSPAPRCCVAGREVAGNQHLPDMSNGIAGQDDGGTHGGRLAVQVVTGGNHTGRADGLPAMPTFN
jgi:hypothetical protein